MATSIMQGDKYAIPFVLQALDGTLITPDVVNTVILNLGSFSRQYPGDVTYENGKWLMPLAQKQTFAMRGFVEPQARVEFSDGSIFGGAGDAIDVTKALSLGIVGTDGKKGSTISKNSTKNSGATGMIFIRINAAGVEVTLNGAVRYDTPQELTEEQKEQARKNIGIDPESKTETQNQPVGIDANGKLWTDPVSGDDELWKPTVSASGDISWEKSSSAEAPEPQNIKGPKGDDYTLTDADKQEIAADVIAGGVEVELGTEPLPAPETAAVGQIIKVKTVDENGKPTETEAADMPSSGSSAITTSTETDISGLLMGEGGKVRKAVPDVDYLKTKELPTPPSDEYNGSYLRWFQESGWTTGSIDIAISQIIEDNEQYICADTPSSIQDFVTAGKTVIAQFNGEPYLLTSVSDQSAVFTRVAGTTVDTITVASDYTAVRTTTTIPSPATKSDAQTQPVGVDADGKLWTQPGGGSSGGGTDISLGVTGAAVGQLVKITAVDADGKPTAWAKLNRDWAVKETYPLKDMTFPAVISIPQDSDSMLTIAGTDITVDGNTNIVFTMGTARAEGGYSTRFDFAQKMYAHSWGCGMAMVLLRQRDGIKRFRMRRTGWSDGYNYNPWKESLEIGEDNRNYYRIIVNDATLLNPDTTANVVLYTRDALC